MREQIRKCELTFTLAVRPLRHLFHAVKAHSNAELGVGQRAQFASLHVCFWKQERTVLRRLRVRVICGGYEDISAANAQRYVLSLRSAARLLRQDHLFTLQ